MVTPKPIAYQVAYLWECPECGTIWQARHRPRSGTQLVCGPLAEQRLIEASSFDPCGSISVSAGRRGGIAPNVSI